MSTKNSSSMFEMFIMWAALSAACSVIENIPYIDPPEIERESRSAVDRKYNELYKDQVATKFNGVSVDDPVFRQFRQEIVEQRNAEKKNIHRIFDSIKSGPSIIHLFLIPRELINPSGARRELVWRQDDFPLLGRILFSHDSPYRSFSPYSPVRMEFLNGEPPCLSYNSKRGVLYLNKNDSVNESARNSIALLDEFKKRGEESMAQIGNATLAYGEYTLDDKRQVSFESEQFPSTPRRPQELPFSRCAR